MSRLREVLNLVKHIPPYPKVAERVLSLVKDPNVTARELATVIQYDQSITANVLKICNSAYFGLSRKITSLNEGLVYIGHDTLKEILITSSSSKFFKGKVRDGYFLDDGDLWRHSVAVGIMSKLLVRHIKNVEAATAYTAGLLHDIGKRILSSFVADEVKEILEKTEKEKCSFVEAEKALLGITHAELGGMILDSWKFSKEMANAVSKHHDRDAMLQDPLTVLVCLGNALVVSLGIGVGADGLATTIQSEGLRKYGISNTDMDLLMADLMSELERAEELLQL